MRRSSKIILWIHLLSCSVLLIGAAPVAAVNPLGRLIPGRRVAADPNASYQLTETDGPWFVLASTFSGVDADEQAHELALELRTKHQMSTFVHTKQFKVSGRAPGIGIDKYGNPIKMKYQKERASGKEVAVLVGNFESIDDPQLEKTLQKIKYLRPDTLDFKKRKKTSQNYALTRALYSRILSKGNKKKEKGPMGHAFAVRNTLLSNEFFVPKSVDPFVAKLNKDVQYSLLNCPGRFTMKVATFRGASMINPNGKKQKSFTMKSKLDEAADKAHRLCLALREKSLGYEAYEFHTRMESIVTIGSFESIATVMPDGTTRPEPGVTAIVRTFAAGDKPWIHPKANQRDRARISQVNHTFQSMAVSKSGMPVSGGVHPKHLANIPFDVMPAPYEVPKHSIGQAYTKRIE